MACCSPQNMEKTGKNDAVAAAVAATTTITSSIMQSQSVLPSSNNGMAKTGTAATTTTSPTNNNSGGAADHRDVHAARMGLLRAIWQTSVAPRFSSKPIAMDEDPSFLFTDGPYQLGSSFASNSVTTDRHNNGSTSISSGTATTMSPPPGGLPGEERFKNSLRESSKLTQSERDYLEGLLKSDDLESIRRASQRLADKEIFPTVTADDDDDVDDDVDNVDEKKTESTEVVNTVGTVENKKSTMMDGSSSSSFLSDPTTTTTGTGQNDTSVDDSTSQPNSTRRRATIQHRNSHVQQQLFEWHEKTTIMPSAVLKRMSSAGKQKQLQQQQQQQQQSKGISVMAAAATTKIKVNNSITDDESSYNGVASTDVVGMEEEKSSKECSVRPSNNGGIDVDVDVDDDCSKKQWNPLTDLNSWIDGSEGVEVDDEGTPEISSPTSNPFKILGTSADDTSCHPHVLSPPLMEGLQLFMPESLQEHHYWLKYSLVRDGPGLMKMLRHCRGSAHTVLAIETTDGHVFGSFTSQPWRLIRRGYYGSKESFVWRMRRSRNEPSKSVLEQILMESKIDVFPFTGRNNTVQLCTTDSLALGYGEVEEEASGKVDTEPTINGNTTSATTGTAGIPDTINAGAGAAGRSSSASTTDTAHHGHAIKLDKSLAGGSTSSSETFGNPCLIERKSRGETFVVANIELWSLTPHETVEEADMAEMRTLFLEECRQKDNNLNLIEILVGTHVI